MINRHLAHLQRQMEIHRILTHVCLHQIGCLCYCCYAKTSSSAVQKRHRKVYGNPIAHSFYSILLGWWKRRCKMRLKAFVSIDHVCTIGRYGTVLLFPIDHVCTIGRYGTVLFIPIDCVCTIGRYGTVSFVVNCVCTIERYSTVLFVPIHRVYTIGRYGTVLFFIRLHSFICPYRLCWCKRKVQHSFICH